MTDLEKQLENRYPEIPLLEKRISELNSMDLSTISVADLRDKINDYFPIITLSEVLWDDRYHVFRVRRNLKNELDNPFDSLSKIGIRQDKGTPFGRANNKDQAIFYGSHEGDLALFESCQNLKDFQRFQPQNFTMGIWKVKSNNKLRLVAILDNELVQSTRPDIRRVTKKGKDLSDKNIKSEKIKIGANMISQFFADQFAKAKIKTPDDYKISAFFADYVRSINRISQVKFDGILFPSVAHKFRADNVALFPESLRKLEFVKCLSITCYNFRFEEGKLTKGILREGKLNGIDTLEWEKKH